MTSDVLTTNTLKPCPFCGHEASVSPEEVRGDDAWCFIRCSWRCRAAPYVGESSCVWYWSEGKRYRHQSDEAAKAKALEWAIKAWNTRATSTLDVPRYSMDQTGVEVLDSEGLWIRFDDAVAALDTQSNLK